MAETRCVCGQKLVTVDVFDALAKATAEPTREQCARAHRGAVCQMRGAHGIGCPQAPEPKAVPTWDGAAYVWTLAGVDVRRGVHYHPNGATGACRGCLPSTSGNRCAGPTVGFRVCRCARCLHERGEGPKPTPALPGVEFATARPVEPSENPGRLPEPAPKAADDDEAEFRATLRACDDEADRVYEASDRLIAAHCAPKVPVDPYKVARVARLLGAADLKLNAEKVTLAQATRVTRERAQHERAKAAEATAMAERLEAALAEVGEP